jgi:hypothetical protein
MVQTMPSGAHSQPEGNLHGPSSPEALGCAEEAILGDNRKFSRVGYRRPRCFLNRQQSPTIANLIANSLLQDIGRTAPLANCHENPAIA